MSSASNTTLTTGLKLFRVGAEKLIQRSYFDDGHAP